MRETERPVRQRLPTAERRLQLLEVAVRVFGRGGYTGSSTGDIAEEAGISAPALYRHYPSKKALYLAALAHSGDRMFDAWEPVVRDAPNAMAAFAQLGTLYQKLMRSEPHLLQMRFRALNATEDPEIRELVLRHHTRAQQLATELAERANQEGLLPQGLTPAVVVAGFMAWGALTDVTQHLGLHKTAEGRVFSTALKDIAGFVTSLRTKQSDDATS